MAKKVEILRCAWVRSFARLRTTIKGRYAFFNILLERRKLYGKFAASLPNPPGILMAVAAMVKMYARWKALIRLTT